MEARKKTVAALNRHLKDSAIGPWVKVAEFDPNQFKPGPPNPFKPKGDNPFLKRDIPEKFAYDPKALKPLAQALWAMSVALGHTLTAHRSLSRIKSSTISPDGLVGGRGYVMSIKDVRKALYDAAEGLSAISDTIHDEINAPHWKPKLAELERGDIESVERLVGEAEEVLENPEEEAEEGMEEAESKGSRAELEEGEGASELPDNADLPDAAEVIETGQHTKQASQYSYDHREMATKALKFIKRDLEGLGWEGNLRSASSIPTQTLPGPRVQHLDRGDVDQTGPFGSYNNQEPMSTHDNWSRTEGVPDEYAYQSEWDNDLEDPTSRTGDSQLPGKNTDPTPTEGYDFGVGYGDGNDAHGQGAGGYGNVDSDGKQVYGPHSELPKDPGAGQSDDSDTTPIVELAVGRDRWKTSSSKLPQDVVRSVARSDYYEGDKGDNEVNAASDLPALEEKDYDYPRDMHPGIGYRHEQGRQPYIKWDSDTHNMSYDDVYQREIEGPFEREG
jgi:hypothetical protein